MYLISSNQIQWFFKPISEYFDFYNLNSKLCYVFELPLLQFTYTASQSDLRSDNERHGPVFGLH